MKKYIFAIIMTALNIATFAQTVNVHLKNGQTIEYSSDNVDYVDFSAKAAAPTVTAGQAVDLGLSVYWASCNIGAESPEEFGDYYAWGETKPKTSYTQENYSFYDKNAQKYTNIGENICGTAYDAATVNLGSDWRMPTVEEMKELITKCKWEWTQINGVNGFKISANNGNSIFLPATGAKMTGNYLQGETIYPTGEIKYKGTKYECSYMLYIQGNSSPDIYYISNGLNPIERGYVIRPVTPNPNAGGDLVDHSQDHFVTDKISASFTGGSVSSINGLIMAGSVLNVSFTNGSDKPVTLVGVQINDAANGYESNNVLDAEVEVSAGETKSYSIRLGKGMTTPVVRFTYRYNKKKYTAEATWTNT